MSSNVNREKDGMTRGKFLAFLGKIGMLSLITGTSVLAAERKSSDKFTLKESDNAALTPEATAKLKGRCNIAKLMASPLINGKMLTRDILEADLATNNLGNIRDLLTGRFFGKAAEAAFQDGYTPLVNWNLGSESMSGCFLQANMNPDDVAVVDAYTGLLTIDKDTGKVKISLKMGNPIDNNLTRVRNTQLDFAEFAAHPTDGFVSEVNSILKTTDVAVIEQELKKVIFSDDVINMGIEHFIHSTHEAMMEDVETR